MSLKNRGSALIISLIILNVITLGAMVAIQRSTVQIRMISNLQHQQEIHNATLGTLNYLYDQLENNTLLQNQVIIKAETLYQQSLESTGENSIDPKYDPFAAFAALTQPTFQSKSIKQDGISAKVRSLPSPAGAQFYLKGKGGCGNGCSVRHAAINVTTVSKNDTITRSQEIGVRRLAPGGTAQ